MKCFTIIKSDSERLPGKNFLPLGSLPLWRHAIDALSDFPVFINCETESLVQKMNALRRPHLTAYLRSVVHVEWESAASSRGSPVNSMLGEFFDRFVSDDEEPVVLFHVTSPFISAELIRSAAAKLREGFRSVQSVQEVRDFMWISDEEGYVPLNFDPSEVRRTQDLDPVYLSRGAFFILTKSGFRETGTRDVAPRFLYPLSAIESIEIDTYDDYQLATRVFGAI